MLFAQVLETYVGIAVIRSVLKGFEPFPADVFSATFRQEASTLLCKHYSRTCL